MTKDNNKTMLIFLIQAYQTETGNGDIGDVTTVELIDKTPEAAIARAKKLIKKKFYRVYSIIEKEETKAPIYYMGGKN